MFRLVQLLQNQLLVHFLNRLPAVTSDKDDPYLDLPVASVKQTRESISVADCLPIRSYVREDDFHREKMSERGNYDLQ